ncbi:MAG: hypothetical protein IPK71_11145 [Myxococcales bacterium]|nr:hypothetical protein [Myxococcales bacterium]
MLLKYRFRGLSYDSAEFFPERWGQRSRLQEVGFASTGLSDTPSIPFRRVRWEDELREHLLFDEVLRQRMDPSVRFLAPRFAWLFRKVEYPTSYERVDMKRRRTIVRQEAFIATLVPLMTSMKVMIVGRHSTSETDLKLSKLDRRSPRQNQGLRRCLTIVVAYHGWRAVPIAQGVEPFFDGRLLPKRVELFGIRHLHQRHTQQQIIGGKHRQA